MARFRALYPEVYGGGTSEGNVALEYFEKWGLKASVYDLADRCSFKYKNLLKENIHFVHEMLAIKRDTLKLESDIRNKRTNTIPL